jgi:hypothetical protein
MKFNALSHLLQIPVTISISNLIILPVSIIWKKNVHICLKDQIYQYHIWQTNLIIELKLTVYFFSKKLGTDHLTSRGGYVFFLNKYSDSQCYWKKYSVVFCFIQKIFPGQHESYNINFFCRTKRNFFSPKFNIRLYDKNSETDFFSFHQNQNIF